MNEVLHSPENVHMLFRFALFMLSQWGWWCFFRKHSHITSFFLPSLTACFQITVLVCVGIAGQLQLAAYGLLIFGAVYLPYALVRKEHPLQSLPVIEMLFLLCMTFLIFRATQGRVLYEHDDFSHWGTVLKELLRTDHFPDSSRMMTEHFTYPMGSAIWMYFLSKALCTNSESVWTFGQALLMLYCMLPLFCFLPKRAGWIYSGLYLLFLICLTNCFLCYNVRIYNLMVDTLLPLVGAAASLFAFSSDHPMMYPMEGKSCRFSPSVWYLIPYLCALIQIKTSGVFFVIAAIAILLFKPSMRSSKYRLLQTGVVLGASFVPLILWRIYCSIHFSGMTAKHDGSLSALIQIASRKSPEVITDIFYRAAKYFLTSNFFIEFSVVLIFAFLVALFISNDSDFFRSAKSWCFLLAFYIIYALSTIGMYLFSMPLNEAIHLASASRYQRTILIYCYYFVFCTILFSLSNIHVIFIRKDISASEKESENHISSVYEGFSGRTFPYTCVHVNEQNRAEPRIYRARILILSCVFVLLLTGWNYRYNGRFLTVLNGYGGTYLKPRLSCEAALIDAGVPQRAKCIVLTTKDKRVYRAMLAFLLGTDRNEITQITIESPDQLQPVEEALREDTWVLIVDNENERIQAWLSQQDSSHIVIIQQD